MPKVWEAEVLMGRVITGPPPPSVTPEAAPEPYREAERCALEWGPRQPKLLQLVLVVASVVVAVATATAVAVAVAVALATVGGLLATVTETRIKRRSAHFQNMFLLSVSMLLFDFLFSLLFSLD